MYELTEQACSHILHVVPIAKFIEKEKYRREKTKKLVQKLEA
jgi:hypothetical protein